MLRVPTALFSGLLTLSLAGCALVPGSPTPSPVPGERRITQGTVATYGQTRLGFAGTDGEGRVRLSQWTATDEGWLSRWRLGPGSVVPAGGAFLQMIRLEHRQRDELVLAPAAELDGVRVPDPLQPVLSQTGNVEIGASRLESTGPITAERAPIRSYPSLRPLADTPPEQITQRDLRVGSRLTLGSVVVRVQRIQPAVGGLEPLVVFTLES